MSILAPALAWNFVQVDSVCRKVHSIGVGGGGALRVGVSASLCGEGAVSSSPNYKTAVRPALTWANKERKLMLPLIKTSGMHTEVLRLTQFISL